MPLREKHNIESNCVTFDDSCYDETETLSFQDNVVSMEQKEREIFRNAFSNSFKAVYKTGEAFVNELRQKIKI